MSALKLGSKYRSAVCGTQIMVIRTAPDVAGLWCGGVPMIGPGDDTAAGGSPADGFADGTLIGKRYIDEADRIELLCTKGGQGSLSLGPERLLVKQPKALPSSD
jgi:hypothetical protein